MPRDGSGNYTLPYPAVVDGTTIESAVHNGTMSDIALQLNGPVPIIAGGTGANNAHDAMIALSGEIAKQGPVGNFDTFPFVNGSWYCNGSSTAAPNSNAFYGTYYEHANPQYAAVYAQEVTGSALNKVYVRFKNGGVWDAAWQAMPGSVADLDARFVNLTGDTMTGPLTVASSSHSFINIDTPPSFAGLIVGKKSGSTRWELYMGNQTPESGGNAGSDFAINALNDTGAAYTVPSALAIERKTGNVSIASTTTSGSPVTGALVVTGGIGANHLYAGYADFSHATGTALWAKGKETTPTLATVYSNAYANLHSANGGYACWSFGGYPGSPFSGWCQVNNTGGTALDMELQPVGGNVKIASTTASTSPTTGALQVAGGIGVVGNIQSGSKGHLFGGPAGTIATGALTEADANIKLYTGVTGNWAGIGSDGNGTMWFRTGLSGTASAAMYIDTSRNVNIAAQLNCETRGSFRYDATHTTNIGGAGSANNCAEFYAAAGATYIQSYNRSGAAYLPLNIGAASVGVNCAITAFGVIETTSGSIKGGNGYLCKQGMSGAYSSNYFNMYYTGPVAMWIDATNLGNITITSDYRIKKDVIDLPSMWDTVKALRPIKYTQTDFTPPAQKAYVAEEVIKARKEAEENPEAAPREVDTSPMFKADNIERWGFIAHELQATLVESASTGVKDSPDHVQSPNPFTVIAALTKALQEAMTRIEALEAR